MFSLLVKCFKTFVLSRVPNQLLTREKTDLNSSWNKHSAASNKSSAGAVGKRSLAGMCTAYREILHAFIFMFSGSASSGSRTKSQMHILASELGQYQHIEIPQLWHDFVTQNSSLCYAQRNE